MNMKGIWKEGIWKDTEINLTVYHLNLYYNSNKLIIFHKMKL